MIEAKSTRGEEIRKENVVPIGSPALVNPMNRGIEEQEQKGVIVPSSVASIFAVIPEKFLNISLARSGGKKLCIYEIIKISADSRISIFTTS